MAKPYLEVTYHKGKPFAAYLYLERQPGDKAARTERHGPWLIDLAADGRVIGVEFAELGAIDVAELNRVLTGANHPAISVADLTPLEAA